MTSPIKVLAAYLTEPGRVVKHSIGLQFDGDKGLEAKEFYALRAAFSVTGYATTEEAEKAITHTLLTQGPTP